MWRLVVDGVEIRRDEYVKLLVEELDYYAESNSFLIACIEQAPPA